MFDSRSDGLPYQLCTVVNGRSVDFNKPMADPFHNTTVTTKWGWRDRLRILIGRPTQVCVSVSARHDVAEAVCELDDNYRGEPGSERRRMSDAVFGAALERFAGGLP